MRTSQRILLLLLLAVLSASCIAPGSEEKRDIEAVREAYVMGFYVEAKTGYERYLQLYPKGDYRLEAWERLLEIALNVEGNLDRSIVLLEAMILEFGEQSHSTWELMFKLAELYDQSGKRDKALETWVKSIQFVQGDKHKIVETHLRMASIYRQQRNYQAALDLLTRSLDMTEDLALKARCRYEIAQTYSFMQSWGQAKEVLEVILDSQGVPEDIRALSTFLLADVYEQEMDLEKARELFESIKDTYPNPKVIQIRLDNLNKGRQ